MATCFACRFAVVRPVSDHTQLHLDKEGLAVIRNIKVGLHMREMCLWLHSTCWLATSRVSNMLQMASVLPIIDGQHH